jgi:hypothetical protein
LPPEEKVRALRAAMEPVVILGYALAGDETFRTYAGAVARRPESASQLAAKYARAGAGRQAIASMLAEAAGYVEYQSLMATWLMNMSRTRAVYSDAPLDSADAKYAPQERPRSKWHRGAQLLVLRGAERCRVCEAHGVKSGYCSAHTLEHGQRERDNEATKVTLRAVAEQLGFRCHGPQARRARRSTHV